LFAEPKGNRHHGLNGICFKYANYMYMKHPWECQGRRKLCGSPTR
jgi:hypothetical protein